MSMENRTLKASYLQQSISNRITSLIVLTCGLTTLAISPGLNFDPINWIKLLILSSGAISVIILYLSWKPKELLNTSKILTTILVVIVFTYIANGNYLSSFWGNQGRATGFLSYLALFSLSIVSYLVSPDLIQKFLKALMVVFLLLLAYTTLQYWKLDPIDWSLATTTGTLGNINFVSAIFGMSIAGLNLFYFSGPINLKKSILWASLSIWALWIIIESGSVQGIVGLFLFAIVYIFILMFRKSGIRFLLVPFSFSVIASFFLLLFATSQKSFLGLSVYQETMGYRRDYWVAAINMIKSDPLSGLGFDQYGSWYKASRDNLAATRTNLNRISDSAHSVFLDISVSAGLIVAALFVTLVFRVTVNALRIMIENESKGLLAISGIWIAYLPQLFLGINQLGVGVWTWVMMGILLKQRDKTTETRSLSWKSSLHKQGNGMKNQDQTSEKPKNVRVDNKAMGPSALPPRFLLTSVVGLVLGFFLALPAFRADVAFNSAYKTGELLKVITLLDRTGINSFHMEKTLELAIASNDGAVALKLAEEIVEKYPRSDYAWKVIYDLRATPDALRLKAGERIRELDPFFADVNIPKN